MKKLNNEWVEEIVRETDHYYNGEMQQEERASWLLGITSALLSLCLTLLVACKDNNDFVGILSKFSYLPLILFMLSIITSIIALIPFKGTRGGLSIFLIFKKDDVYKSSIENFVKSHFKHDGKWSKKSYYYRLFFHLRSHYIRNLQKSRMVGFSAVFLLLGILSFCFIFIRNFGILFQ